MADRPTFPVTPYQQALARYKTMGAAHADEQALMAAFCAHDLQPIVGAVSPALVWQGAVKRNMGTRQLAAMAASDPLRVGELQWI